ncbi:reverse transcriptase domain-containing protein [Tanacetum coccineum]
MAAHTKRIERFEEAIYNQREEINKRMAEMFSLLKEFTKEKEEAVDDVVDNESDGSVNEDSTNNNKYNDSLLATCLGKMDNETYNSLPVRPVYNAFLKKKLARKDGRGGNFVIPCSIGRLKIKNALADQGYDANIMPLSIYNKLSSEKPVWTNIRLSLANHSYLYTLGLAKDVLIDAAGFVYPVNFVILNIKEDEYMPLILGTPFLTTARVEIKFDKGAMTLKNGRYKIRFARP